MEYGPYPPNRDNLPSIDAKPESKRMTVRQMIEALSKLDPELPVVLRGYEGGYDDVQSVDVVALDRDVKRWPYGNHSTAESGGEPHVAVA